MDQSLLGIELLEGEARVVLSRVKDGRPVAIRAGRCALPVGAVAEGRVQDASLVATSLRELLGTLGAKDAIDAVFGVPLEHVVFRAFTIPAVPDLEVRAIVAGEVGHFNLLASGASAYDFVHMTPPVTDLAPVSRSVAVFGVDGEVTAGLREVAALIGLRIRAVEPSTYAMYRAAMLGTNLPGTVFALMLSAKGSEIAYVHAGVLVAYRRIETGSSMLLPSGQGSDGTNPETSQTPRDGHLPESAKQLAIEVRRIVDYLEREYPLAVAERLEVVVDDPALEPISSLLADRLNLDVELVRPMFSAGEKARPTLDLSGREGLYYSAAYGLAMHYASPSTVRVQPIDLYAHERSVSVYQVAQKNFVGSIMVSVAALVLALVGYFLYRGQIATVNAAAHLANDRSTSIRNATDAVLAERAQHAGQYRALRHEGVPLATVMESLATGLEPGVGLSDLSINSDLKVLATVDAVSEPAMLGTVQNLQHSLVLTGVSITSFQQAANSQGFTFHLAAQTVSMDRIRPSGEEKSKR